MDDVLDKILADLDSSHFDYGNALEDEIYFMSTNSAQFNFR